MNFCGCRSGIANFLLSFLAGCWLVAGIHGALADTPPRGYYLVGEIADAEADAQVHHLPLVWMSSDVNLLTEPRPDDDAFDLSQMACAYLSKKLNGRVVLLVFYNSREISQVPQAVQDQMNQLDDPDLTGTGTNYKMPKLVFTNGNAKELFGRVSSTQMKQTRELAIYDLVKMIYTNPDLKAKLVTQVETPNPEDDPFAAAKPSPTPTPTPTPKPSSNSFVSYIGVLAIPIVGLVAYIAYMQKKQGKG